MDQMIAKSQFLPPVLSDHYDCPSFSHFSSDESTSVCYAKEGLVVKLCSNTHSDFDERSVRLDDESDPAEN
jgi:hypothetical protein